MKKLLASLFVSTVVVAQPLQPLDLFNLSYINQVELSPDGETAVYAEQFFDIQSDQGFSNLHAIKYDGTHAHQLTFGNYRDTSPAFSPDGKQLAFVSNRSDGSQIYLLTEAEPVQLTHLDHGPTTFTWSPDGTKLAFTAFVPDEKGSFVTLPAAPEGAEWATPARLIDQPIYRFFVKGDVEAGTMQLFTLDIATQEVSGISNGKRWHGIGGLSDCAPIWSANSQEIVVTRASYDGQLIDMNRQELVAYSVGNHSCRTLFSDEIGITALALSPDGTHLALLATPLTYAMAHNPYILITDMAGQTVAKLATDLDRPIAKLTWPNESLAFMYDDRGDTKLATISLDGTLTQVGHHIGGSNQAYGLPVGGQDYAMAANGNTIFNVTRAHHPSTLQTPAKTLVDPNSKLLSTHDMCGAEPFTFTSSLDGLEVEGWILKPADFDPSNDYPLILDIHGGPVLNVGDRFDIEKQLWAASGYVVVYTNYRGSNSYGSDFSDIIQNTFPINVEHDLITAVDAVIARGYIDPSRLYITGGSAGGILSCWTITKTDRFAAAAPAYPVVNQISETLTTDIGLYFAKNWSSAMPWEAPLDYWARSPLAYVDQVTTPTLLLCGDKDARTPISESEQFYSALKICGCESAFVRFPGEPHGIRRRPSHHLAKILYIQHWFDSH